jgi:hypothetical protein
MTLRASFVFAVVAPLALALPAAAADAPTLRANPLVVGELGQVVLSGTSPRPSVTLEAKECDSSFFRIVGATRSVDGTWSFQAGVSATTAFRARSGRAVSRHVVVRKRAVVDLVRRAGTRIFVANVHGGSPYLVGRRIRLERHTDDGWVLVARAKLRRHPIFGRVVANFRVVRRGLVLRALVTEAIARPCLAAGVSPIVRS